MRRVMEVLGASSAAEIVSEEFGDGNLNLVFRCRYAHQHLRQGSLHTAHTIDEANVSLLSGFKQSFS